MDTGHYGSLMCALAGLAKSGNAAVEDGEALLRYCAEDGIEADEITWAGMLDIIVGWRPYPLLCGVLLRAVCACVVGVRF